MCWKKLQRGGGKQKAAIFIITATSSVLSCSLQRACVLIIQSYAFRQTLVIDCFQLNNVNS